jgi:hypothetical protein
MATPTENYTFAPENDAFYSARVYKSLDKNMQEIRLLKVDGLGLGCHELIDKVSLKNNPRYWALSYFSGSPSKAAKQVLVNNRPFNAFVNLAVAVDHVRAAWKKRQAEQNSQVRAEPLVLWTDQICD